MIFRFRNQVAFVVLLHASLAAAPEALPATEPTPNVDQLIADKNYLELENLLGRADGLDARDRDYVEGIMANRTNRVAESIRLLEPLVTKLTAENKQRAKAALSTLADDYEKDFRYGDAADTYARLARNFADNMTPAELRRATREAGRWELLREAPPQQVSGKSRFKIETVRDAAGLLEAPVTIGGQRVSMVLDTGANLSVISQSFAQRLRLKVSGRQTTVTANAPGELPAHTAIIPLLRFGTAEFRNVAVLVLEDAALEISELHYRIPGSLGFPVLSALGRITFFADGRFGAGLPSKAGGLLKSDLFLEKLTPVVAVTIDGKQQLFTIDTGSTSTLLSASYYREHHDDFVSQQPHQLDLLGAGTSVSIPAYNMPKLSVSVGGETVSLTNVPVMTEPRDRFDTKFCGNLGQDLLRQFRSYSFDFRKMVFVGESTTVRRHAAGSNF